MIDVPLKLAEQMQRRRDRVIDTLTRAGRYGRTASELAAAFVWPVDSMRALLIDLLNRGDIIVHPDDEEAERFIAVAFEKELS